MLASAADGTGGDYLKLMSMYVLLLAQATEDAEEEAVEVDIGTAEAEDRDVVGNDEIYGDVIVLGGGDGEDLDDDAITITEYDEFHYDYPDEDSNDNNNNNNSSSSEDGDDRKSGGIDLGGILGVLNPFNWMKNETETEESIEIDVVDSEGRKEDADSEEGEEEEEDFVSDWPEVIVLGGGDSALSSGEGGGGDYQADDADVHREVLTHRREREREFY